jgi:hypothetical protein
MYNCTIEIIGVLKKYENCMTKLMTQPAIADLRYLLSKDVDPKIIEQMTDDDISFIGFFLLEVFIQGLNTRNGM